MIQPGIPAAPAPLVAAASVNSSAAPPAGEIIVYGRALPQIGVATSGSQGVVGYRDFADRPLSRVGELVENVPGVIATQHSGSGKANQYFLRGFNLDHGTDFAGFVDGVPINMRTHGHGQGYLDLNFLIPELVERIDYRKGPYFADVGDFSAAGTVKFTTVDRLTAPFAEATAGSYGYYRALVAGSRSLGEGDLLVGIDGTRSNGPWTLDEHLRKINGLVKYSSGSAASEWSLGLTAYHAKWRSTDQIPERAITSGLIGRFGNIDPYLGGATTRIGLTGNGHFGSTDITLFALYYRLRLTSNFTYYLDDPVNGDEFQQRDQRGVFGGSLRHRVDIAPGGLATTLTFGSDLRYDAIGKVGLYQSIDGVPTTTDRQDRVDEASGALFAQAETALTHRLRLTLGLRGDRYAYRVRAETLAANSGSGHDGIVAPKAALAWRATDRIEFYLDYGESFHSNDARGATIRFDPKTGAPIAQVPLLVRARGSEAGMRLEWPHFTASLVGYYLTLGSELVYSGDGGTTEPNDASRRYGTEATLFWRPVPWLAFDAAAAFSHARFHGAPAGESHIPNSVGNVASAGATLDLPGGISGSLRLRHLGAAPLIEDDSARSNATTLVNLGTYYRFSRFKIGLDILNLFDARQNDITYFYVSRLPGEPSDGVADYHLHPVEPRQYRVSLRVAFG